MSAVERVVLVTMSPWSDRDRERFGAATLTAEGLGVEVWDLTSVLYPARWEAHVRAGGELPADARRFATHAEVAAAVAALPPSAVPVCLINFDHVSLFLFEAFTRSGVRWAFNVCNIAPTSAIAVPTRGGAAGRLLRLASDPAGTAAKARVRRILAGAPGATGVSGPSWLVAGGRRSIPAAPFFAEAEPIWAHTFDYDRWLAAVREAPEVARTATAVFLDHGTPFHPDRVSIGAYAIESGEAYYAHVNAFLRRVESELGLEVVIAAHPRWEFAGRELVYEGRAISRDTVGLVRAASLVVAHNSTSLNFVGLARTPAMFITSPLHEHAWIAEAAAHFGKEPHTDPAGPIDWDAELRVDEARYARFVEDYVTTGRYPGLPVWAIVARALKEAA